MERGHVVIFAVVIAALGLFGLTVWSDRANEAKLTSGGRVVGELARLDDPRGGDDAFDAGRGGTRKGRAPGQLGDRNPLRPGAGPGGTGARAGGDGGRVVGAGGTRAGDGWSGSGRSGSWGGGSGGGGANIVGGDAGGLGPQVQKKHDLVDFLSSQPATQPELAHPDGDGDIALKIDTTDDITKQGGVDKDVLESREGEGIEITDSGKIQFPNTVNPEAATIEFSIEPNWAGADQTDNAFVQLRGEHEWSNRIELVKNGEFLRFIVTDNTGREADISVRISDWQMGDRHDIRASYGPCESGGSNCTYLYVDGRLAGTNKYEGQLQFASNTPLFVGGDHRGSTYAGAAAKMSGFTIRNSGSLQ